MGSDWNRCDLAQIASHQKGFAFKSKDYQQNGVAVVRVSNLTSNSIDVSDLKYVSDEVARDKSDFKLTLNDVVIATVGSWPKNPASVVGKVIKVPEECDSFLLNQNAVRFRVKSDSKEDQLFLYYLLKTKYFAEYIVSTAQGSANQASITLKDIYAFEFEYPNRITRKQIVKVLDTLEQKINLNHKTNQTLEQMAQALFKSWFVDFDPVLDNALAAGNPIPEPLQTKAERRQQVQQQADFSPLPADIRALFPSEFEQTDESSVGIAGWVPKGWAVRTLEELITLTGGGTPKTSIDKYWNGNIPWFSVVDAPKDSDVYVINTEKKVTKAGVENSSTKILARETTIISARGTVGKCALVGKPMAMNQSCYGINGKGEIADLFVYFLTKYQVSDLQKKGHGSVFNTITRETFRSIKIVFSGVDLTLLFEKLVRSYLDRILLNNEQIDALKTLRDTLLPKLISGEISLDQVTVD